VTRVARHLAIASLIARRTASRLPIAQPAENVDVKASHQVASKPSGQLAKTGNAALHDGERRAMKTCYRRINDVKHQNNINNGILCGVSCWRQRLWLVYSIISI